MSKKKVNAAISLEREYVAPNYHPLPVVLREGHGAWVTDINGNRYLDGLAGYSAVNFGHTNRRLLAVAHAQLDRLTMTSRAFYSETLGPFSEALADLAGTEMVLPMNTGAEAVETAIKASRKWGYKVKGVADNSAEIIVMSDNFHGRTSTIVSFSDDEDAREGFGPYMPGFTSVPFGDVQAVRDAITPNTVAVLTEPIQGEAGVIIPPDCFLPALQKVCEENNVLLVVDEIQSGFGRTGATFAFELVGVKPDLLILGKALGGGLYPVSAVTGRADVLRLLSAGSHGSTFGGNPTAAAIGFEVVKMMKEGVFQENARVRGRQLAEFLDRMHEEYPDLIRRVSRIGLWAAIEFDSEVVTGRQFCEKMQEQGVLLKDAHGSVVRMSPPLVATEADIDFLCEALERVISSLAYKVDEVA